MSSYKPNSLLPKSYEEELHALDIANAKWIENIRLDAQKIETLANPMLCPIEYLPFLADAFGVEFYYEEQLDEEAKRLLVQNSLLLHSKKGTKWAIEKVLELLAVDGNIKEWFQYNGEPYHFRLLKDNNKKMTNESIVRLKKMIEKYKNVRSVLEYIEITEAKTVETTISTGANTEAYTEALTREWIEESGDGSIGLSVGSVTEAYTEALTRDWVEESGDGSIGLSVGSVTEAYTEALTREWIEESGDGSIGLSVGSVTEAYAVGSVVFSLYSLEPIHRISFKNDLTDSVGLDDATLQNGATMDSSGVILGSSGKVTFAQNLILPHNFTISFWFKQLSYVHNKIMFSFFGGNRFYMGQNDGYTNRYFISIGDSVYVNFLSPIVGGTWNYITATLQDGVAKLYRDGVLQAELPGVQSSGDYANHLGYPSANHTANVQISNLNIYERAITQLEILEEFNNGN